MKLWVDTDAANTAGRAIQVKVSEIAKDIDRQMASRAARAVTELRNAELDVLKGQRSGRVYRKYPYKSTYTASAPGEPPARRTGALRLHWNGRVETSSGANGRTVTAVLESGEKYAPLLENGTNRIAARPFHDRILERARPKILQIYEAPYR